MNSGIEGEGSILPEREKRSLPRRHLIPVVTALAVLGVSLAMEGCKGIKAGSIERGERDKTTEVSEKKSALLSFSEKHQTKKLTELNERFSQDPKSLSDDDVLVLLLINEAVLIEERSNYDSRDRDHLDGAAANFNFTMVGNEAKERGLIKEPEVN